MTYDELLAEFQRVTGHKPGEMNKRRPSVCMSGWGCILEAGHEGDCEEITGERHPQSAEMNTRIYASGVPIAESVDKLATLMLSAPYPMPDGAGWPVSLEPPAQSAGPGRCSLKYCGKRCVLADGHAGAHEL